MVPRSAAIASGTRRTSTPQNSTVSRDWSFPADEALVGQVWRNEAIREVIALIQTEVQQNRVRLQTRLADDLSLVPADRVQLRRNQAGARPYRQRRQSRRRGHRPDPCARQEGAAAPRTLG
jgi:hypothetical protein